MIAVMDRQRKSKKLNILNDSIVWFTEICYVALIFYYWKTDQSPLTFIALSGISFGALSLFRKIVNRTRPYVRRQVEPLLRQHATGNSFPSRHVFSIFLIARYALDAIFPLGVGLMLLGVLLAIIRVKGEVHEWVDVIVGMLLGVIMGSIGLMVMV